MSTNTDRSSNEFDSLLLRKSSISAISCDKQGNMNLSSPTFALTEVTIDDDNNNNDDDVDDVIIINNASVDEEANHAWFETSDGESEENKAIKVLLRNGARDIILTDSGSDASGSYSIGNSSDDDTNGTYGDVVDEDDGNIVLDENDVDIVI
jgi:hypothetical protein